ncbi:hypothetical protein [Caballeronia sp. GAWG2-1]|uniref:hypothetical protein n=1 Tax=Caballeronia sp. GAWG2-1 TaxID=2921744 RepID=UPI0020286893|nr:hypothetical protein [Caballeronia sp. GAWG2-1]
MIKIDRIALAQSNIAGGAVKQGTGTGPYSPNTPAAPTQTGTASSVIIVNGQTVISQSVTF